MRGGKRYFSLYHRLGRGPSIPNNLGNPQMRSAISFLVCLAVTVGKLQPSDAGTLAISVNDAAGQAVPCRIHVKDAAGKSIRAPGLPFWRDHFVCSGRAAIEVPAGRCVYEIERGPEYRPATGGINIPASGQVAVAAVLVRIADMPSEGWYAGDFHVHRPVSDIPLLLRAEDLHAAPVITWWNKRVETEANQPQAATVVRFEPNRFYDVMAGEDERGGGAVLFLRL